MMKEKQKDEYRIKIFPISLCNRTDRNADHSIQQQQISEKCDICTFSVYFCSRISWKRYALLKDLKKRFKKN